MSIPATPMDDLQAKRPARRWFSPVENHQQLSELRARWASQRQGLWISFRIALAIGCGLVVINLATTAGRTDLSTAARAWSSYPLMALLLFLAPATIQLFWLGPRALHAQSRLLEQRDLLARAAKIEALERRLRERLATRSPARGDLVSSLEGRPALMPDLAAVTGSADDQPKADSIDRERCLAILDAYRIALGNLEIDALLAPSFLDSEAAAGALERAIGLLRPVRHLPAHGAPTVTPLATPPADPLATPRPSIAVLPFTDLSPKTDQQYFCDGIAEELISALTAIQGLRVVARSSAFSFRSQGMAARDIGRALDVTTVLDGSVRKAGDRVRISAQLVSVAGEEHLWSRTYDRQLDDVFAIQDEIAREIAEKLKVELALGVAGALVRRPTKSLEAYNRYLMGRFHWNRRTEEGLRRSLDCFQRAVEEDPSYAHAFAGIADCYTQLGDYGYLPPDRARAKAKDAARQALALDETVAEARASLAYLTLLYDWDWTVAEREFERALELKPNYAPAHQLFAEFLTAMGRMDEAIDRIARARELDPLSLIVNTVVAWVYYRARQFDRAIEQCRRTLDLDPNFALAHHLFGWALGGQSKYEEAIAEAQRSVELSGGSTLMTASLGFACAAAGDAAKAGRVLDQLMSRSLEGYVSPYDIALLHTGMGNKEEALVFLEKAYQERCGWLVYLNADAIWDSLRSEPGFRSLVERVGLPT